jgi:transposase
VNAKRSLAERISRCEGCDLVIDRKVGAAKNLLVPALRGKGTGGAEGRPTVLGMWR